MGHSDRQLLRVALHFFYMKAGFVIVGWTLDTHHSKQSMALHKEQPQHMQSNGTVVGKT